jgi:D-glycero-D-manno-heptose 1,7-bisphosphate phosphatase
VFIDRDGVINRAVIRDGRPYAPETLAELDWLPGVAEAMAALRAAGFRLIVATNQPDVGAGRQSREVVEAMHAHLRATFPVDDIRVCYHTDADGCACRKPKPGMLVAAAHDWGIDLPVSVMVGDRWRDIDAGRAAGCRTILVESLDESLVERLVERGADSGTRRGYNERPAEGYDAAVSSLLEASRVVLNWQLPPGPPAPESLSIESDEPDMVVPRLSRWPGVTRE